MCLSRRWATSWWKCSERSTLGPRTRLSKCPRSFLSVFHSAVWRVVLRSWRNSWWKCRLTLLGALISSALGGGLQGSLPEQDSLRLQRAVEQILNCPVPQGRRRRGGGLQGFYPLNRIQQQRTWSRSLIFLHMAVFKVSLQVRDQVVDIPVVVQTQIPMVRFTIEILQSQYVDQVVEKMKEK